MNINDLLTDTPCKTDPMPETEYASMPKQSDNNITICNNGSYNNKSPILDDHLMSVWERNLREGGITMRPTAERNTLTDAILVTTDQVETRVHIKVIGRHMNGSFRCHIGTGKASRPIRSSELCRQMRLLAVFFRAENSKSQLVSPEFIFFPSWLLHLFRYTQHGPTPGRTDVRFLEEASQAKEDHIYRLNNVLNRLFRFNLHCFDHAKFRSAVELGNYLFDVAGLDHRNLPRPFLDVESHNEYQPKLYTTLLILLQAPRPSKLKPMCHNCNTKPASRRRLCVACYRYKLKHGEPRPLRLIVANRPGPRVQQDTSPQSMVFYSPTVAQASQCGQQKRCANCSVHETHQWYRNLCGSGHWCETCKSYYLRHSKVRPPELFVKAAKRKVDVRTLVDWSSWSWDDPTAVAAATALATADVTPDAHSIPLVTNSHDSRRSTDSSTVSTTLTYWQNHHTLSNSNASSGNSSPTMAMSSPTTPPAPATYYPPKLLRPYSTPSHFVPPCPYWSGDA